MPRMCGWKEFNTHIAEHVYCAHILQRTRGNTVDNLWKSCIREAQMADNHSANFPHIKGVYTIGGVACCLIRASIRLSIATVDTAQSREPGITKINVAKIQWITICGATSKMRFCKFLEYRTLSFVCQYWNLFGVSRVLFIFFSC